VTTLRVLVVTGILPHQGKEESSTVENVLNRLIKSEQKKENHSTLTFSFLSFLALL
jgi:hypothetical protein